MLPMKDLSRLFEQAGCTGVRTYIQSGNVIFKSSPAKAGKAPPLASPKAIADQFGYRVPVLLRSAEELGETIRRQSLSYRRERPRTGCTFCSWRVSRMPPASRRSIRTARRRTLLSCAAGRSTCNAQTGWGIPN